MAFLDKTGLERLWLHIVSKLGNKVDKVDGKGLSTNDYTTEDQEKLATLGELVGDTTVSVQINSAIANITTDSLGAVNEEDYYGLVEKEGAMIAAKSLDGAGIKATSYITATQEGSGDASLENIRAIGGWDTANITRCGKNLFNKDNYEEVPVFINTYSFTYTEDRSVLVRIKPNTSYTVKKDTQTIMRIATSSEYPAAGVYFTSRQVHATASSEPLTITSGENDKYLLIQLLANDDTSGSYGTVALNVPTLQVEVGTTATAYEAYNEQTLATELPETVYGGTLDWTTGLLTVDKCYVGLTGGESWAYNGAQFVASVAKAGAGAAGLCSHYPYKVLGTAAAMYVDGTYLAAGKGIANTFASTADWKNWLAAQYAAGTPVQVVYPLAEPYTIQLTAQQLEALHGINTVWSDCGNTRALFNYSLCGNYADVTSDPVEARENLLIVVSATEPASPETGMLWFDIS